MFVGVKSKLNVAVASRNAAVTLKTVVSRQKNEAGKKNKILCRTVDLWGEPSFHFDARNGKQEESSLRAVYARLRSSS